MDIKAWRKANNYSQQDLADSLGRHVMTISKWETEASNAPADLADQLSKLPTRIVRGNTRKVKWFTMDLSMEITSEMGREQPYAWRFGDMNGNYALFSYGRQHLLWYNRERDQFLDIGATFHGKQPDLSHINPGWLESLRAMMAGNKPVTAPPPADPTSSEFNSAWDHAEATGDFEALAKILGAGQK